MSEEHFSTILEIRIICYIKLETFVELNTKKNRPYLSETIGE